MVEYKCPKIHEVIKTRKYGSIYIKYKSGQDRMIDGIKKEKVVLPGLEPGTFSTSKRRDNRYTIRPSCHFNATH